MLQERGRYDSSRRNYGGEIPRHLLTREWRFTSHRHIMTNTKMTRQLENRKKQILRRPQRPLTLMPSQHQESFSSTTNLVTDPATIPLEGQYTWLRGMKSMRMKSVVSLMEMGTRKTAMRKTMMGVTIW